MNNPKRRQLLRQLSCAGTLAIATAWKPQTVFASADTYPSRPMTWIVPFAVGGPTDALARVLAQRVAQELGQSIIIQNFPGAGGTVGAAKAARMAPDGYTLFVGHIGTMAAAPYLFKSLAYDPNRDFSAIFRFPDTPMALLVRKNSKYRSATELLEAARQSPGTLTFATAGVGSSSHLAAEHLAAVAKVKFTFVPYKGTGPAMTDLIGGQIDAMLDQANVTLPQVESGTIRALALTSQAPMPQFPGVPTLAARELPGFTASTWYGLYAPAGTPRAVIERLEAAYGKAMADTTFAAMLTRQGIDVLPGPEVSAAALTTFTQAEQRKWQRVIRDAGIELQ